MLCINILRETIQWNNKTQIKFCQSVTCHEQSHGFIPTKYKIRALIILSRFVNLNKKNYFCVRPSTFSYKGSFN